LSSAIRIDMLHWMIARNPRVRAMWLATGDDGGRRATEL
jgi:hypothetical protein